MGESSSAGGADSSPERIPVRRGRAAQERVLSAALDVLADFGLNGFTIEAVARRAGASKATIYRCWSTRDALLLAAMEAAFQPFLTPDTGSLRADLLGLVTRAQDMFTGGPFARLMAAFIDAAERDPALADLHFDLTERRRAPVRQALERARARGQIASGTDVELAIDLLTGPLFYRRLVAHRPFPASYLAALVDHVLAAIAGPPPDSGPTP